MLFNSLLIILILSLLINVICEDLLNVNSKKLRNKEPEPDIVQDIFDQNVKKKKSGGGANWHGSQIGTKNYKMEAQVINEGIDDYNNMEIKPRKNLLCVVFIRAELDPITTLSSNIFYAKNNCDWAIVIYDGTKEYEDLICQVLKKKEKSIVFCSRSKHSLNNGDNNETIPIVKSVPKTTLYFDILPIIPLYNVRIIYFIIFDRYYIC